MALVYNVSGTEDDEASDLCGCSSWKQHWENNSTLTWKKQCVVARCQYQARALATTGNFPGTVGGHVSEFGMLRGSKIAPICSHHNNNKRYNLNMSHKSNGGVRMQIDSKYLVSRAILPKCPKPKQSNNQLVKELSTLLRNMRRRPPLIGG